MPSLLTTCRGSLKAKSFRDASLSVYLPHQQMGPCGPSVGRDVFNKPPSPSTIEMRRHLNIHPIRRAAWWDWGQRCASFSGHLQVTKLWTLSEGSRTWSAGPHIHCTLFVFMEEQMNMWQGCIRKRKEQEPSCPLVIKEAASIKTSQLNVLINCVLFWMVHYKYLVQLGHISYTKTLLNLWPQLNIFSLHLFGY